MKTVALLLALLAAAPSTAAAEKPPSPLARPFVQAIRKINDDHARKPGKETEADLARKLPAEAKKTLENLLKAKDSPEVRAALAECADEALNLDLVADFDRIRSRLESFSADAAKPLGVALSRPRFLLIGLNGLDAAYLQKFAEVFEAILSSYDETFGFKEWNKVPGKKIRVRVHLEEEIKRPPYFAPEFAHHSLIDFPVVDAKELRSPVTDKGGSGKMMFFGLCHELGHLIAMWGDFGRQEDFHQWADYTGYVIVERLSETGKDKPFMSGLQDVNWRSLSKARERIKGKKPSLDDADGMMALLIALHDAVGPKAIGDAMNLLDAQGKGTKLQYQRTRYYSMKDFRAALLQVVKDAKAKKAVADIFPDAANRGRAAGAKKR